MSFADAWKATLADEGGYSNHAADHGGATKWGVTERVARKHGYTGAMQELPIERAKGIGKSEYWDVLRLDEIDQLSPKLAAKLFDAAYNCGTVQAARWLQRALTALNRQGKDYADIPVDGLIGSRTVLAFADLMRRRGITGEVVLLTAVRCQQGAFYLEISQTRPENEAFLFGWLEQPGLTMQPLSGEQGAQGGTPTLGFTKVLDPVGGAIAAAQLRRVMSTLPRMKMGIYEHEKQAGLAELRGKLAIADLAGEGPAVAQLTAAIAQLEAYDTARFVYYVYPKSETVANHEDGSSETLLCEPDPGPEFVRLKPHPDRGDNPNVFVRRDDPYLHLAEVLP